jgi:L-aspartate oxidase
VAGVERSGHALGQALSLLRRERQGVEAHAAWRCLQDLPHRGWLELAGDQSRRLACLQEWHQRLTLAELLIEAARFRQESRGGHFRTDAPCPLPYWRRHSLQRIGASIRTAAIRDEGTGETVLRSARSR